MAVDGCGFVLYIGRWCTPVDHCERGRDLFDTARRSAFAAARCGRCSDRRVRHTRSCWYEGSDCVIRSRSPAICTETSDGIHCLRRSAYVYLCLCSDLSTGACYGLCVTNLLVMCRQIVKEIKHHTDEILKKQG